MDRHEFDWTSAIFGGVFIALGIGFAAGNLRWEAVEPVALIAVMVAMAGLLIAGSAVRRIQEGAGSEADN